MAILTEPKYKHYMVNCPYCDHEYRYRYMVEYIDKQYGELKKCLHCREEFLVKVEIKIFESIRTFKLTQKED